MLANLCDMEISTILHHNLDIFRLLSKLEISVTEENLNSTSMEVTSLYICCVCTQG